MSSRSYEGQIVGYTETQYTYWIKDKTGKTRLAKSPKPIQDNQNPSEAPSSHEEKVPTREDEPNPKPMSPMLQSALETVLTEITPSRQTETLIQLYQTRSFQKKEKGKRRMQHTGTKLLEKGKNPPGKENLGY